MKIVVCKKSAWSESVNVVDENNVLVGFDGDQSCCEHAELRLARPRKGVVLECRVPFEMADEAHEAFNAALGGDLENFRFDTSIKPQHKKLDGGDDDVLECVEFTLRNVKDKYDQIYLRLSNAHNGYYSRGWEYRIDGELKEEGSL